jgi:hypothetical protein
MDGNDANTHRLVFRALLADGVREARLERTTMG